MKISRRVSWARLAVGAALCLSFLAFGMWADDGSDYRAQCAGNLKRIVLALHKYHDAHGHFPGNIVDKDGKPLLSWRVAILPYIEEARMLHKEFKLDEPWDSPHNKPLLDRIPKVFECPIAPHSDPTLTSYLGFEGKRAFFEKGEKVMMGSFTDDPYTTFAVVEAAEGLPWTKPADLPFDENAPPSLYGAGSAHPGGFNAAMADGSVRFIKATDHPVVIKARITRNGDEVILADQGEPY